MKLALLEYLCCGGLVPSPNSQEEHNPFDPTLQGLLNEGFAMWRAVSDDLAVMGHCVVSVIDPAIRNRIADQNTANQESRLKLHSFDKSKGLEENWIAACQEAERVLVIAPEIDNTLTRIVERLRIHKKVVIASSKYFLKVASDKWLTYQNLEQHIQQPKTWLASELERIVEDDRQSAFGFVLKPRDGAGGSSCLPLRNFDELAIAIRRLELPERWLVQSWQTGLPCSAAMIIDDTGAVRVLGATEQLLQVDRSGIQYKGARGLLNEERDNGLANWCEQVLALIPGAFGWIGIDYLLPPAVELKSGDFASNAARKSERVLIEINPRLTTSYLLYRKIYGPHLSEGLLGLETKLSTEETLGRDQQHLYMVDPNK